MSKEKKHQAKNLFFQTELSKSQIADLLGISRRSIHYWVKEGNWERLRSAATDLPSLLAEKCYHIIGHLTDYYCSERRLTNPVSYKEADTLHKLVLTINKLKNRSTLNENMEMFSFFLEGLRRQNPQMADGIAPYVDQYISSRAAVYQKHLQPDNFNEMGRIPHQQTDYAEQRLDGLDFYEWEMDALEREQQLEKEQETANEINTPDEPGNISEPLYTHSTSQTAEEMNVPIPEIALQSVESDNPLQSAIQTTVTEEQHNEQFCHSLSSSNSRSDNLTSANAMQSSARIVQFLTPEPLTINESPQ